LSYLDFLGLAARSPRSTRHFDRLHLGRGARTPASFAPRTQTPPAFRRLVRPPAGRAVHPAARRGARHAVPRAGDVAGGRAVRAVLRGAHVRHNGVLPPVLRPPGVKDEPVVPVRARVDRVLGDAEGPAVVGRAPPPPPQALRPGGRPALADRADG